jgi:hypothetical protein
MSRSTRDAACCDAYGPSVTTAPADLSSSNSSPSTIVGVLHGTLAFRYRFCGQVLTLLLVYATGLAVEEP